MTEVSQPQEERGKHRRTSNASSRFVISRHWRCRCAGIIESTKESKNLTSVAANDWGIWSSLVCLCASYGKLFPVSRHWINVICYESDLLLPGIGCSHLPNLLDHIIISRSKEQVILPKLGRRLEEMGHTSTGVGLLVIIQSKSRIISDGAFVDRISG